MKQDAETVEIFFVRAFAEEFFNFGDPLFRFQEEFLQMLWFAFDSLFEFEGKLFSFVFFFLTHTYPSSPFHRV